MAGVVRGDLRRLFAAVSAASPRCPAKAKLFPEHTKLLGEDGYAWMNHRLTRIMHLPPADGWRATYSFLRGDAPLCRPASTVRRLPPWNPFDGTPGDLQATFQRAPLHALLGSR